MAKTGRVCDFTGQVFALGAPETGTIVATLGDQVITYDVTAEGMAKATKGWPDGASRKKFKRAKKDAAETPAETPAA